MNKKGFSLIELLSVVIILGIVATIGISAVSSYIGDSRKSTFADLAKLYGEKASEERAKDRLPHDIKDKEAILLPMEKYELEKNEDFSTPYGKMNLDFCYVVITNNGNMFNYYVFMLDDSNHAIVGADYAAVTSDAVTVDPIEIAQIINYKTIGVDSRLSIGGYTYKLKSKTSQYVVLYRS